MIVASNFSDPHNERIIYLAVGGLIVLGVVVLLATVWWWRGSRIEHPALAPLELMNVKGKPARVLAGADGAADVEPIDLAAVGSAAPTDFADLAETPEVADVDATVAAEQPGSVAEPASSLESDG